MVEVLGSGPVPGVAGLVLTGGSSRRMGRDKATIVVDGVPCAELVGRRLSLVAAPALEVGPGRSQLPVVVEDRAGQGPLAAVAAGWAALAARGHHGPALVVACDMPLVTEALLRFLARAPGSGGLVPVVEGHPQPLCARFGGPALAHGARMASAGHRSLAPLLDHGDVTWLGEADWGQVADSRAFSDLDTPADLERLGLVLR